MIRVTVASFLVVALLLPFGSELGQERPGPTGRETVLDRVEHVEAKLAQDVPRVAALCDGVQGRRQKVDVGDCRLYCEQEGQGTPLVLIHGGPGATHHYFHPYFSLVKDHFRVIYYDQRGCGLSDYRKGPGYSVDQAVDDLEHLRQALKVDKWIVLGHSYGGVVAQCYALKYPEHLVGLVLVDSAFYGLPVTVSGTRQYEFITPAEAQAIQQVQTDRRLTPSQRLFNAHLNGDWKRQSFYRPSREELARLALYEWKHDDALRPAIAHSLESLDLAGKFDACPIPVLIMEGTWDLTWSADKSEKFARCFPEAKLVLFARAGHSPFADEPKNFFATLREFADGLPQDLAPQVSQWKVRLAELAHEKETSPERVLAHRGWGRESAKRVAEEYSQDWLPQLSAPVTLLKLGFALYDMQRYDEARTAFARMSEVSTDDPLHLAMSRLWQGHMLDLLGRRQEAVALYQQVAEMNVTSGVEHTQYNLTYSPSADAAQRLETPFTRIENQDRD
jgi:proline iminopeptidase